MANLRGLRGSEWVAWVGVGCVGWSESDMVTALHGVWLKYKTSFPCIINIHNEAASCILSQLLNFCSPCVLALLRSWMITREVRKYLSLLVICNPLLCKKLLSWQLMIMCQNHVYHILNATLAVVLRVNERAQHLVRATISNIFEKDVGQC